MRMSRIAVAVSALMPAAAVVSCVNAAYDLNRPIDMTVKVDGDISVPLIKNSEFITVGELLKDTELGDNIVLVPFDPSQDPDNPDTKGYYMLSVKGDPENPISASFGKLDFDLAESLNSFEPEPLTVSQPLGITEIDLLPYISGATGVEQILEEAGLGTTVSIVGNTPAGIKNTIDQVAEVLSEIPGVMFNTDAIEYPEVTVPVDGTGENAMPIEIVQDNFPEIINEIGEVDINADITLKLGPNFGKIVLKKGFRIDFPERIHMEKLAGNSNKWSLKGSTITCDSDFEVYEDTGLNLRITGIDATGCIKDEAGKRKLEIKEEISVSGEAYCDLKNIIDDENISNEVIPSEIAFESIISIGNDVTMGNVRVKLDLEAALGEEGIEDQIIEIGQILPEEISKEDVTLDVYNPVIILKIANDSPLNAIMRAGLHAYGAEDTPLLDGPITLEGININADTKEVPQTIAVSRKGSGRTDIAPEDDIKVDELGELISKLPEKIAIKDIEVAPETEQDGYTVIDLSGIDKQKELGLLCNYEVQAPLAFGEELNIEYALDTLKDLNKHFTDIAESEGEMKIDLKKLNLDFEIDNGLPIALGVTVTPLDIKGEPMVQNDDLRIEIGFKDANGQETGKIMSIGSDGKPQRTSVNILIAPKSFDVLKDFDGLLVKLTGNAGQAAGIPLSNAHGLQLFNVSAHISGGVEMDLENM